MPLKLTAAEINQAAADLWVLLISGHDDDEAQSELGIDGEMYGRIKRHMLDQKAQEVKTRPTEHTYVQYILDQARNIRDLTEMLEKADETKQHNAVIGAIRLRADLHDRILQRGQECGLVEKEPNRTEMVAGVIVADLTSKQLQGALRTELKVVNSLMKRFGDKPFLDVEAGPIHYGPKLEAPKEADPKPKKKKQRMVESG